MEPEIRPSFRDRTDPFSPNARQVYQLAIQQALRLDQDSLAPEHLLWGIASSRCCVAANALMDLNLNLREVRQEIEKVSQRGTPRRFIDDLRETYETEKVIECAIDEARGLRHKHIGTEHILLGILREHGGVAGQVLNNLGITWELARTATAARLGTKT